MTRAPRRDARGATLIELMVAGSMILVALLGFIGATNEAAHATSVGQRRTVAGNLRTAALERFTLMRRDDVLSLPQDTWLRTGCYDENGVALATSDTGVDCKAALDAATYQRLRYDTWTCVHPSGIRGAVVYTLAQRVDMPCATTAASFPVSGTCDSDAAPKLYTYSAWNPPITGTYCVIGETLLTD